MLARWRWLQTRGGSVALNRILVTEMLRNHPLLYEYLEYHLAKRPIEINGVPVQLMKRNLLGRTLKIPLCVVPHGDNLILEKLEDYEEHVFQNWENAEFIQLQRQLGKKLEKANDKLTFESRKIVVSDSAVRMFGGITRYGSALVTQDVLEWELLSSCYSHFKKGERSVFPKILDSLKKRRNVEDLVPIRITCDIK